MHCFFDLSHWHPCVGFTIFCIRFGGSLFLQICLQTHNFEQPSLIRRQSQRSDFVQTFLAGFVGSTSHEHLQIA